MSYAEAFAKINLSLIVGPLRRDGKHEVVTVLQAIDLCDDIELTPVGASIVDGFPVDTLVRDALERLAEAAGVTTGWHVRIEKRIPVAAGLGGGSSDAAAALELANSSLATPLSRPELHVLASEVGADVPFFLSEGAQLGTGDGSGLAPLDLPTAYVAVLVLPEGAAKNSTASVYREFDERNGASGFEERRSALLEKLDQLAQPQDLAKLPRNDLASSPLSRELEALGAFRADVTGAGPAVYGLFEQKQTAERAAASLQERGSTCLARPVSRRSPSALAR